MVKKTVEQIWQEREQWVTPKVKEFDMTNFIISLNNEGFSAEQVGLIIKLILNDTDMTLALKLGNLTVGLVNEKDSSDA